MSWRRLGLHRRPARRVVGASPSQRQQSSLVGSAPSYRAHLILHDGSGTDRHWPRQLDDVSPVHAAVCRLATQGGVWRDIGIGYSCDPASPRADATRDAGDGETLSATLYPAMHEIPFDVTLASVAQLGAHLSPTPDTASAVGGVTHIYVCTHGSRDCRCGDLGSALYEALSYAVRRRMLSDTVSVRRISHVGGHKWAANAIVYPSGDWYGRLRPDDAPALLDAALDPAATWWSRWRGRTGLTTAEMEATYEAAQHTRARDAGALARAVKRERRSSATALGEPVPLRFRRSSGDTIDTRGFEGETLKDVAKRLDLVEATCGGFCECATCAVDLVGAILPSSVPPPGDEELDQLEFTLNRSAHTRLACQIPLTAELAAWTGQGGYVQLPRY